MTLLSLPVLLYYLPAAALLTALLRGRLRQAVPALGGAGLLWLTGGFPSLTFGLVMLWAGWLVLRLQPQTETAPRRARRWVFAGVGTQALLLFLGKYLLTPMQLFPLLLCGLQHIECIRARAAGQMPIPALFPYACYSLDLFRLLGGPLLRWQEAQEILSGRQITAERAGAGAGMCIRGLFQLAVLSLPMQHLHAQLTAGGTVLTTADACLTLPVFYFSVYYGLRGAARLGQGISLMLGLRLPDSFDTPLYAGTLHGFWRRFLRPMTDWCGRVLMRDPEPTDSAGYCARVMLMLGGCGLVLGQNWCGMLWGVCCALLLTGERRLPAGQLRRIPSPVRRALTALLVLLPLGILRSSGWNDLFPFYGAMLGRSGIALSGTCAYLLRSRRLPLMLCTAGLLPIRQMLVQISKKNRAAKIAAALCRPLAELAMLLLAMAFLYSESIR